MSVISTTGPLQHAVVGMVTAKCQLDGAFKNYDKREPILVIGGLVSGIEVPVGWGIRKL